MKKLILATAITAVLSSTAFAADYSVYQSNEHVSYNKDDSWLVYS